MMYDQERAQQPESKRPDPATRRGPQRPHTGPARTSHEPAVNGNDPDRTPGSPLLPQGDRDKLTLALQQAVSSFAESPRQAVEEADSVLGEAVTRVTETLVERHRVLRASWQDKGTEVQPEELRLALRQYGETTELLLHI